MGLVLQRLAGKQAGPALFVWSNSAK